MFLSLFSSFIQFCAGLGLLFSYEKIIEKSPIYECQQRALDMRDSILLNYKDYISEKLNLYIKNHKVDDRDITSLIRVYASLTLMYSFQLLLFVGFEFFDSRFIDIFSILGIDIFLLLYLLIVLIRRKSDLGKSLIINSMSFFFVAIVIYFAQIFYKESFGSLFQLSRELCVSIVALTCMLPMLLIAIVLLIGLFKYTYLNAKAKKLQTYFEAIFKFRLGYKDVKIPDNIRKRAAAYAYNNLNLPQEKLNHCLEDEIRESLERYIYSWYYHVYLFLRRLTSKIKSKFRRK